MIEVYGDLWEYDKADARCITTNGYVKTNGAAVMGRGCAYQATKKFYRIEFKLGNLLKMYGNHVFMLYGADDDEFQLGNLLFSFPVKHNWNEQADIDLINQSASELLTVVTALNLGSVVIPRPGCGNGNLNWEDPSGVKFQLERLLDDRFHVIDWRP